VSSAAGANARVQLLPATLTWFAIQARYRFEKRVAEQLSNKGVEVFLPLRTEKHTWSDRQKAVTVPLFPGYFFAHFDTSMPVRREILKTSGLMKFVEFGGAAVAVPAKQIEDLRTLLQQDVPFSLGAFVRVGQCVRIRGGCLHGLEGVLAQRDMGKLVISIESIQRSLAVEIHGYELDLV
jgi:transcription antitermination factor NusG